MSNKTDSHWEAATWEGSRRAQLRRSLKLTPRERLEAMVALDDTAQHLAHSSRRGGSEQTADGTAALAEETESYGDPEQRKRISLAGCTTIPLVSYLKALGILRLVAEQVDSDARGYWRGERFMLESRLDEQGLRQFFLEEYRPTPLLAPWGARSGFYPGSAESGARKVLGQIEDTTDRRLAFFRDSISAIRAFLEAHGFDKKPEDDQRKLEMMRLCRSELDDRLVQWLDACYTLTSEWRRFPPLLGTGGNEGSGSYLSGFGELVVDCLGKRKHDVSLDASLFQVGVPNAGADQVPGQFAPAMAGGANQGAGFSGHVMTNPWDYILALEGTLLFASASTRRLGSSETDSNASFPFTVNVTGAGSGATAQADERGARAEMWLPLWESPTHVSELQAVLNEGRVTLGQRPARTGLDFVRAVARLGVNRGLESFQRYTIVQRYGKNVFAVALNRVPVKRNTSADLVDQLDANGWLNRCLGFARRNGGKRLLSLVRRLEDAIFELVAAQNDPAPAARKLLALLGEAQLYLARSPAARDVEKGGCPPVPSLSPAWLVTANDGSPEMAVAAALAGFHARQPRGDEEQTWIMPMRAHLAPERVGRMPAWDENAAHQVTWGQGSLEGNLIRTLQRRLLEADQRNLGDKPLEPSRMAPLEHVAAWLAGALDTQRIAALLPGLMLVRIPGGAKVGAERGTPLPAAYRLLKPFFCTDAQLRRSEILPSDGHLSIPADLVRRLAAGTTDGVLEAAQRRLRAAGVQVDFHAPAAGISDGRRLLAALLVPIADYDLQCLLPRRPQSDIQQAS